MQKILIAALLFVGCQPPPDNWKQHMELDNGWQLLNHQNRDDSWCDTHRLEVPDGWLVRITCSRGTAMSFVPDPNHSWMPN